MTHPSDQMTREDLEQTTRFKVTHRILQLVVFGPVVLILLMAIFGVNKDEGDKRWRAEQTQKAERLQEIMLRDADKVYK